MSGEEMASTTRVTRASAEASRRRQALGDVSNKRASRNGDKAKAKTQPRRSARLSNGESDAVEHDARRQSPRLSTNNAKIAGDTKRTSRVVDRAASRKRTAAATRLSKRTASRSGKRESKRSRVEGPKETVTNGRRSTLKKSRSRPSMNRRMNKKGSSKKQLCDMIETADFGLRRVPFDPSKYILGVAPHDSMQKDDVQEASKYVTDIYQRLYHTETLTHPRPYMDDQPQLSPMMRSILIDWIVEVHMKFRLLPETLYLCVNIIDRYLSRTEVTRKRLQLVGVTALLLACKYEEIYPPEVKDCVYITDRTYTRQEVIDMEAHIVKILKFQLTVPTGHPFLLRFLHILDAKRVTRNLANFYMERMLQEYGALYFRPSLVAAAAVSLALNNPDALDQEGFEWHERPGIPLSLLRYGGFCRSDIVKVAKLMESNVGESDLSCGRRRLIAVKKKYESDRYGNASVAFALPKSHHLDSSSKNLDC